MKNKTALRKRYLSIAVAVLLAIGICLRIYQYFMGRSLWEDEAHLALNFIYYGYKDLTRPLAHFQSAPIFFLYSVETVTRIFGFGERALRLFPFLVSVTCYPLIYSIVRALTKSATTALVALLIFSLNVFLIYYSSELKPYTLDVCAFLLLTFLATTDHAYINKYRNRLLMIAGSLLLFYSNATMVVLACAGSYIVYLSYREKKLSKQTIKLFAVWGIVFMTNFFLFVYKHPYAGGMRQMWAFTFCPVNPFSKAFVDFIYARIQDTFFTSLLYISDKYCFNYLLAFIIVVATCNIFYTKRYAILFFTWLPVLLHLVLSALKVYPFYFRFILYLLPCFIILIAFGTDVIANFISSKIHKVAGYIFLAGCCAFYIQPSISSFPLWDREIKPSLRYINDHYPHTELYITTPLTLYEYYTRTGFNKNIHYKSLPWDVPPKVYDSMMAGQHSNYILLHSTPYYDGYKDVMDDLRRRNLIVREFEYKTYTVTELKPVNR